jgi:hypothetical protein
LNVSDVNELIPVCRITKMPPHPNHPCHRCRQQFAADAVMLVATKPARYWNRIRTAPVCEACLTPKEHETAIGQGWVGCRGCLPHHGSIGGAVPPVQSCAKCRTKFRRARACNLGWHYLYEV